MTNIVCVTSCVAGIAHTYMAAEALEQAGKKLGYELKVETQGSAGSIALTAAEIAAADGVIFAVDLKVRDRERFIGKPFVEVPVSKAMHGAQALITGLLESIESGTAQKVSQDLPPAVAKQPKAGFLARLFGKK